MGRFREEVVAEGVAIQDWVHRLAEIPPKQFALARVTEYLQGHPIKPETLQPYLFYAKSHYTRNLIFKCDLFEVIAICWEVGQVSRIHNHRDQNCWMAVPIGRLRVQNFRVENRDGARKRCRIVPTDSFDMDPAHPGTVEPEEPVHQVLNLAEFGGRATSIHVYSRPYSNCEVYSLEKGEYADVPLHYSSEYGELCPDEKLL
jgi:cysteine dioxygenase